MGNAFKKGVIFGGLLAAGAFYAASTKSGKKLVDDVQKDVKELGKELKAKIENLEELTKDKYDEIVDMAVEEYAKKKKMAMDAKETLVEALKDKWDELQEDYEKVAGDGGKTHKK